MAVDKLVDSAKLNAALNYEANKIIAKGGGTAPLAFDFENEKGFGDYVDAIPSGGGGGATVIASGTFTGSGYTVNLPVGKKMPKTSFGFRLRLQSSSVISTDASKFTAVGYYFTAYSPDYFDFSANGKKYLSTTFSFSTSYSGSITSLSPKLSKVAVVFYRGTNGNSNQIPADVNAIAFTKADDGFTANVTLWNANNHFAAGATYEWELLYFGSDPTNDIVEVP